MSRCTRNHARLVAVLSLPAADLEPERVYRFTAPGFMDLVVERLLDCPETGAAVLSLAHYFQQNGDLCADPEMTVRVFEHGMVEALTFQQAIPPVYREVYPSPGKVDPRMKADLNEFLELWLQNLVEQRFSFA